LELRSTKTLLAIALPYTRQQNSGAGCLWYSMKVQRRLAITTLAGVATFVPPAAARDVEAGYIVAQRFCASCHEIERGRFRSDQSPSFATIASRPTTRITGLEMLLSNPYYNKPDNLTLQEIEDVSVYIFSLK
jgi:hypothetical protein